MRQNYAVVIQLHAEQTAGEFLQHDSGNFYIVFLTHPNLSATWNRRGADPPVPHASIDEAFQPAIVTFAACNPLGPLVTSNSTFEPSSRLR